MPSFDQAKILFVSIEAVLCGIAGLLYLYGRPKRYEKCSPISDKTSSSKPIAVLSSELQEKLQAEKKDLLAKLESMTGDITALQSSLQLENEKSIQFQKKLDEAEKKASLSCTNKKLYSHALLDLSVEIQKLCHQIEQDRKTHAVEIRALLGKEEKKVGGPLLTTRAASSGILSPSISPIAAVFLLLLQCQKGFDKSEASSWPDAEHRDLIRRAFFDRLQQASHVPLAVFSLERPTELYVSPKFPQTLSSKDCREISEAFGQELRQLSSMEPLQLNAEYLQGMYVAFKVAGQNLDDLVVMVPMSHP